MFHPKLLKTQRTIINACPLSGGINDYFQCFVQSSLRGVEGSDANLILAIKRLIVVLVGRRGRLPFPGIVRLIF